jgi:hypothetical protein
VKPAVPIGRRGSVPFAHEAAMYKRRIYRGMPSIILLLAAALIQCLAVLAFI